MDEDHLLTAARYVELNPVRAGLVQAPSRYRWSSAAAHLRGRDDALVQVAPLLQMAPNRRRLLTSAIRAEELNAPRGQTEFQVNLKLGLTPCPPRSDPMPPLKLGLTSRQECSGKEDSWKLETFQMEPCR